MTDISSPEWFPDGSDVERLEAEIADLRAQLAVMTADRNRLDAVLKAHWAERSFRQPSRWITG